MTEVEPTEQPRVGQPARVALVAFGGIYLGMTVAWLFAAQANQLIGIDDAFDKAMIQFGEFFAIVSPILWFYGTLSQIATAKWRIASLVIGTVVLFPFPLFFGVSG